jgi:glycosyltransferase involved in cell wall biosynthesis
MAAISLVTPVLNRVRLLPEALASALGQEDVTVEVIVVDGGSTDGTLELLRHSADIRLIEAPGSGIYDAVNRGIAAATAPVIGWLNSDDLLPAGSLAAVLAGFAADPAADAIRGRAVFFTDRAEGGTRPVAAADAEFPLALTLADATRGQPSINAVFFRRELLDRIGPFDQRWPLAGDRDWLVRAFAAGWRICPIDRPVYAYRRHGGSLTLDGGSLGNERLHAEYLGIARRHLADPTLPRAIRAECRRWQAKEIALLTLLRGRAGLATALAGLGRDPAWPVRLLPQLGALAWRRYRRRRA